MAESLPDLALIEIFRHLDVKSRLSACLICRKFNELISNHSRLFTDIKTTLNFEDLSNIEIFAKSQRKYKHIVFTGNLIDEVETDIDFGKLGESLEIIEFMKSSISKSLFEKFLKTFRNLKVLIAINFSFNDPVIEDDFPEIELNKLQRLMISDIEPTADFTRIKFYLWRNSEALNQLICLIKFMKKCKNLKTLYMIHRNVEFMKEILVSQNQLKHLNISGFESWNLLESLKLETLVASYLGNSNAFVNMLKNQHELKFLDFSMNVISTWDLTTLFENLLDKPELQVLNMEVFMGFPNLDDLTIFSNYSSNLRHLKIFDANIVFASNHNFLEALLMAVPKLEKLYLIIPSLQLLHHLDFYRPLLEVYKCNSSRKVFPALIRQAFKCIFDPNRSVHNHSKEFLKHEGIDFQFWYYENGIHLLETEAFKNQFPDIETLLVNVSSIEEIVRLPELYKKLKKLYVFVANRVLFVFDVVRDEDQVKFEFEHPLQENVTLKYKLEELNEVFEEVSEAISNVPNTRMSYEEEDP